ncbi:CDP-glycerol glycerophosphotransferase family protein [Candidatus Ventrimonas sp. KK005]
MMKRIVSNYKEKEEVAILQYYIKLFCCFILKFLYILPMKNNRIIFEAYSGKSYCCNPKYIYKAISKKFPATFEIIWVMNQKCPDLNDTICVKRNTVRYCYYMLTSKVIITNIGFNAFIPYRNKQLKINTWHGGGAYKKIGIDINASRTEYDRTLRDATTMDIILSSGKSFSKVFSHAYHLSIKKMWEIGMPRNDILFSYTKHQKKAILKHLGLNKDDKLVIYAPTFRGHHSNAVCLKTTIHIDNCLNALKTRFGGKWIFGSRMHHTYYLQKNSISKGLNLTNYPDMQELLIAADVLITDYSSCMWDFSLTGKPCFLYADDLKEYMSERNFYTPISSWPFSVAFNNEQLSQNILDFDEEEYAQKIKKHHCELGICETGHAAEIVADFIDDYCFDRITKSDILTKNQTE